jgi:sulfotransferase family protein
VGIKGKVNLLIIGAQKAGTTSLYYYLKQHPSIYFSEVKEVNYFGVDEFYKRGVKYYHSFFPNHKNQKVVASAYVHMLPNPKCPQRVKEYNPDMKFIVMLRDPLKRAISAYKYAIQNHWERENVSFTEAFNLEQERLKHENPNYDITYFYNGLYYQHLSNWIQLFPKEQFYILIDSDLKNNPEKVMSSIFEFLNIDKEQKIDFTKKYNEATIVRSKFIQGFLVKGTPIINKTLGFILPRSAKLYILSKVLPQLRNLNSNKIVTDKNSKFDNIYLSDEIDSKIANYFLNDLKMLNEKLNIQI